MARFVFFFGLRAASALFFFNFPQADAWAHVVRYPCQKSVPAPSTLAATVPHWQSLRMCALSKPLPPAVLPPPLPAISDEDTVDSSRIRMMPTRTRSKPMDKKALKILAAKKEFALLSLPEIYAIVQGPNNVRNPPLAVFECIKGDVPIAPALDIDMEPRSEHAIGTVEYGYDVARQCLEQAAVGREFIDMIFDEACALSGHQRPQNHHALVVYVSVDYAAGMSRGSLESMVRYSDKVSLHIHAVEVPGTRPLLIANNMLMLRLVHRLLPRHPRFSHIDDSIYASSPAFHLLRHPGGRKTQLTTGTLARLFQENGQWMADINIPRHIWYAAWVTPEYVIENMNAEFAEDRVEIPATVLSCGALGDQIDTETRARAPVIGTRAKRPRLDDTESLFPWHVLPPPLAALRRPLPFVRLYGTAAHLSPFFLPPVLILASTLTEVQPSSVAIESCSTFSVYLNSGECAAHKAATRLSAHKSFRRILEIRILHGHIFFQWRCTKPACVQFYEPFVGKATMLQSLPTLEPAPASIKALFNAAVAAVAAGGVLVARV